MNANEPQLVAEAQEEIPALIEALLAAERRLEELTAGEVDTVTSRDGRTFLLGRAQEQLRRSETTKQAAILNALPAHIALLDTQGVIISVNESWRRFANANFLHAPEHGIGLNYLDVCDRARGHYSGEAHQVAAGIRAVLGGAEKSFSIEYPCHSPKEQRWFLLTVTPLADDHPNGAVVMHLNITARKLAAKAMEELSRKTELRERILNSALSSMSDFAQIYSRDGHLIYVNQSLLTLWGLTLEEVVGKNFFELGYPAELAAKLHRQVHEVFDTKQSITDDTPYLSPMGLVGWYEYIFSPVCAPDGTVDFVVGSTREITGGKQAEEALRLSEERLRSALSASSTGTFRWDIRTNVLSWDSSLDALFGIPAGSAVRSLETFIATVHPDDRPGVIERCQRCAREGADFDMEFRVIWPDGSLHWLDDRGKTFLDASGQPLYMTGACVDITKRKQAEEASRESEERFRGVADNITDVFWMMSHDMKETLYVSQAYEAIWGFSMESLYADPHQWLNAVLPEDREAVIAAFVGLTKDDATVNVEYRIRRPDGTIRWIHDRGFQVRDAAGRLVRNAGLATDITERKEAAEALDHSRKRLRDIIDGMGPSMFVGLLTPDGILVEVNRSPLTAAGLKAEDVLGKPFDETPWWSDSPEAQQQLREAIARAALGEASRYDVRTRGINNQFIDLDFSLQPLRDETGEVVFLIPSASVITERKVAETALRASEAEFRALAEAMPQMVWITRPDGWCTYFSQQWMDYTGLTLEESLGTGWIKPFHPEDQQRTLDAWQNATTTKGAYSVEVRLRRADGVYRWWLIRGVIVRDTSDNILKWFGTCTDIDDLKVASASLTESERRLALATESAHIGIWDWDMVTNQLRWDDQMYALYGIQAQDFSGAYDAWQKGLHPEDRARAEADINAAVHGASGFHVEFRVLWPNGEVRHIEAHGSVQRAVDGSTAHMIGVNWDITARKQAEQRLAALHTELIDTSRRAGMAEVATGVLHNVGNVLNSMNVSTSIVLRLLQKSPVSRLRDVVNLLADHAADLSAYLTADERGRNLPAFLAQLAAHLDRETREISQEIRGVAENVEHIKQIVSTQQRYAGNVGVLEPLDLRDAVDDALRIHGGVLNHDDIEIVRKLEPVSTVIVDKHKVLQILINLISNAKGAMADSPVKSLTITTSPSPDGGTQVSVQDTGCGIIAENITRIFSHGFTTKRDGHGFGLHSSALAAAEMNALLIAQSDGVGRGANFTLRFPRPSSCQTAASTPLDPISTGASA